jgi:hypothetical protein|tara:strand:- start:5676 stop:5969 length:294 start_codon:yes stop_codon:yes gene_type:complete
MNKETAHLYLPFVQALADGDDVQYHGSRGWDDPREIYFSNDPENYRIKPKEPLEVKIWVNNKTNKTGLPANNYFDGANNGVATVRLFREVIPTHKQP